MIAALGCGIGAEDFDIEKLRYHRIIIMTDADVDGSTSGRCSDVLLQAAAEGHRERLHYIAQPPLFRAKRGKSETYIKDERELEAFLIKRSVESRVVRVPSTGLEISGAELEKLLHKVMAHEKFLHTVERRGHPREIIEGLVSAGADREYFADKDRMDELARTLTTPTRTVTVQRDEEHNRYLLHVDDRSNGYPRQHSISVDLVTGAEYRALLANRRDIPAFGGDIVVSTTAVEAPDDTAAGDDGAAEAKPAARQKPAEVRLRSLDELVGKPSQPGRRRGDQPLPGLGEMNPDQLGARRWIRQSDAAAGARGGSHRGRPDV
jgi:DNA gyrase subunit B